MAKRWRLVIEFKDLSDARTDVVDVQENVSACLRACRTVFHSNDVSLQRIHVTGSVKSHSEIKDLFHSWYEDPTWDLYVTDGFEAHREELRALQAEQELKWVKERQDKIDAAVMLLREAGVLQPPKIS